MRSDKLACVLVCLSCALVACAEDDAPAKHAGTAGAGGDDGGASDARVPGPTGDEAIFESILAGSIAPRDGLVQIANAGGFPIATSSGFVFARLDDGTGSHQLTGDFDDWVPRELESGPGLQWVRVEIAAPDGAKYKFLSPSGAFSADPFARRYGYDEHGEHSLVRASAAHLERFVDVASGALPARELRVWVPALAPTRHLYVHDGQNLFDPSAPFGSWKLHESVSDTTLVVGIDNAGAARIHEYTHVPDSIGGDVVGGGADDYTAFVRDVVRPLIDARYGAPKLRGVMGSSLGGLVAFHQVLHDPAAWQFAASLSGTFGWGSIGANNETLIARFSKAGKLAIPLYLDSGGGPGSGCVDSDGDGTNDDAPDAKDNFCETEQLKQVLEASGWQHGVDLTHFHEPDAPHNEAAWAARVFRPVQQFEAL